MKSKTNYINRMRKNSLLQVAQKGSARLRRAPLEASVRKPIRYKAPEIPKIEAYIEVRRNDEG